MIAAVRRIAPCVVGIETVGGMERAKDVLLGTGPTTGLVIDPQGYIVSSAFNFVSKPASILVRLPDGTRKPAKLVAADHSRMLVLLKIEVARPLPAPEIAPLSEMRVGQWCIAVGRTFQPDRPNMSVGVLSATGRIWGKALQTDAAVSPNNYGGPLVDLRGRVLGFSSPCRRSRPTRWPATNGTIPASASPCPPSTSCNILPRLKQGRDLYTGLAGVSLRSDELFLGEAVIAACRARSPAAKAGLRAGDRVVEIGGRKIARSAELKEELSRRYAGDKVAVVALRGAQRIAAEVELVAKLAPYQPPLLGVLPMRTESQDGVAVRYVYPQSPAAGAGIAAGDVLVEFGRPHNPQSRGGDGAACRVGGGRRGGGRISPRGQGPDGEDQVRPAFRGAAAGGVAARPCPAQARPRRVGRARRRARVDPGVSQPGLGVRARRLLRRHAARPGRLAARRRGRQRQGPVGPLEAAVQPL